MKGQLDCYTVVTMETLLDLCKWTKAGGGLALDLCKWPKAGGGLALDLCKWPKAGGGLAVW